MTKRTLALFSALALGACSGGSTTDAGPPDGGVAPGTYANVVTILNNSCALSSSCHGGAGQGQGHLNLARSISAGTLVADLMRPSCEYSAMPILTPGDPANSWLYVKSTGPTSGMDLMFTPSASWNHGGLTPDAMGHYPASTCPLTQSGAIYFGQIMPMGTMGLPPSQAETLRMWIAAGAPGP
jgi:hypothetical protein